MNVLLSWLREFAPIEGSPDELAATLTDLGLVVEDVRSTAPSWGGVIVARVLGLRPHPEADRIQLVDVDTGGALTADGEVAAPAGEGLQICCGAFNMEVGDLVPLATLGTVMPNGMEIARRKMRGEWSNGMLCSGTELEISSDSDGIHILDSGLTVGQDLAEALGRQDDWLFEIDVEGNRPDALSVAGIARDLAARLGVAFAFPVMELDESGEPAAGQASVSIGARDFCARFGVRVLETISMTTTPAWMVERLTACGVRSINPIVDISNYVMLELGQPNHTYDLDLVPGGHLGVRMAREGEELVTLDDQQRTLTASDGVIVDADDQVIGLAGVMGGASTEITDATTRVILEAAVWDRMTIARTSRRLGLRSEASTRFERGVDPLAIERALDRFCALAVELCGATIAPGRVVVDGGYVPTPPVRVRVAKVNHLLNTELDMEAVQNLLDPIGFTSEVLTAPTPDDPGVLSVTVPSWRPDSSIEEDIVEEIGRHHGYGKSGARVPSPPQNGELTEPQRARRRLRRAFLGAGFTEAMPLPFLAPDDLERAGLSGDQAPISLENPLVAEESILRTSLLPGLLKAVAYNESHRNGGVRFYELGRVFLRGPEGSELPDEQEWVAAVLDEADGREAVRLLWHLARVLGLDGALKIVNGPRPGLHPTRSAEIVFRGRTIGEVGEIDPRVAEAFEVSGRVGWIQLAVEPLLPALTASARYKPVSNYPSSDIDLAFVVADDVPVSDLTTTLSAAGRPLLQRLRFLNAYRSESLGEGVRSLAFGLRLQADDRTLTDAEVAEARQKMIDAVASKNAGVLRG